MEEPLKGDSIFRIKTGGGIKNTAPGFDSGDFLKKNCENKRLSNFKQSVEAERESHPPCPPRFAYTGTLKMSKLKRTRYYLSYQK